MTRLYIYTVAVYIWVRRGSKQRRFIWLCKHIKAQYIYGPRRNTDSGFGRLYCRGIERCKWSMHIYIYTGDVNMPWNNCTIYKYTCVGVYINFVVYFVNVSTTMSTGTYNIVYMYIPLVWQGRWFCMNKHRGCYARARAAWRAPAAINLLIKHRPMEYVYYIYRYNISVYSVQQRYLSTRKPIEIAIYIYIYYTVPKDSDGSVFPRDIYMYLCRYSGGGHKDRPLFYRLCKVFTATVVQ